MLDASKIFIDPKRLKKKNHKIINKCLNKSTKYDFISNSQLQLNSYIPVCVYYIYLMGDYHEDLKLEVTWF